MHNSPTFWPTTLMSAALAVALAAAGLVLNAFALAASVTPFLLVGSLACTAVAFTRVALRVRRIELENEGLIEEISQEFDNVKDKIEIFAEALDEPRSLSPEEAEKDMPMRRVMVK